MDNIDIKIVNNDQHIAKIKVIGVGGCGSNLVNYMSQRPTSGVNFVAINTDAQALASMSENLECIQIGNSTTKGLGAGGKPEVSREAALSESERLRDLLQGMDMVFVVAGMGKGTGTGASPVIAEISHELGILTVAVVVMPFKCENRAERAEGGLQALSKAVDSLIVAPNEKLREVLGEEVTVRQAYLAANDLLYNAVSGISDIINKHGDVNVDFNDVRSAMSGKGKAVIGSASASGEGRATKATEAALHSELMENVDLTGASHILLNITGDVSMGEMSRVDEVVKENIRDLRGEVTLGHCYDEAMGDELRVTVIVTGVSDRYQPKILENTNSAKQANGFFESGRKQGNLLTEGKSHRTPSILREQTN
ncbi:MAG: cell division protein FtsZ [Proteobacteria bacterium]|nr:cell division protein FtsZ [Pseudomonadota bacterium]